MNFIYKIDIILFESTFYKYGLTFNSVQVNKVEGYRKLNIFENIFFEASSL